MHVLDVNNLRAYYFQNGSKIGNKIHAVEGVTFSISKNEVFGIAGESGCGKSTLLKLLYGYIAHPLEVVSGSVEYTFEEGTRCKILSLNEHELRRDIWWKKISYIPQGSMNILNPVRKVRKSFLDVAYAHSRSSKGEAKAFIESKVRNLGLPSEVLNSYPHQLSGGMRQRVTIALATLYDPGVLIADEPTTALDVVVQRGVIQLLKEVQERLGNTIILVTHDMAVQANISDRIGIMYAGEIVEISTTNVLLENPLHPYTKFLIDSAPEIGTGTRKEGAPGAPPSLASPPEGCRFFPRCRFGEEKCKMAQQVLREVEEGHYVACCRYDDRNV